LIREGNTESGRKKKKKKKSWENDHVWEEREPIGGKQSANKEYQHGKGLIPQGKGVIKRN